MADYTSIKSDLKRMLGMKFGSYKASVKNLSKKYEKEVKTASVNVFYKGEKRVAISNKNVNEGKFNNSIEDLNTGRSYSTGWQEEGDSDKFRHISFKGFSIEDSNNNGRIDKKDLVYDYSGNPGVTVGDILSGKFPKEGNDSLY